MARTEIDLSHLPQEAQEKIIALREQAAEALTLVRDAERRRLKLDEERTELQGRLDHYRRPQARLIESLSRDGHVIGQQSSVTVAGLPDDDPRMQAVLREAHLVDREMARLQTISEQRQQNFASTGQLLNHLENFAKRQNGATAAFDGVVDISKAVKGNNFTDAVESRRRRQRELAADARQVSDAPVSSAAVKQGVKALLDRLEQDGAPSVHQLIDGEPADTIKLPEVRELQQFHGATRLNDGSTAPTLISALVREPHLLGVLCWFDRARLERKLFAEIDKMADDANALSDVQRRQKLLEIERDSLHAAREEEALIQAAERQGINIARRVDANPVAVLNLAVPETH